MTGIPVSWILMATGFVLMAIGLWGILVHRNILRIIIGFTLLDTGIPIVMVAMGYVTGGTAPIIDADLPLALATERVVDPIPSALTVTAIVIGFSVSALMLAFAVRIHRTRATLDIDALNRSRW